MTPSILVVGATGNTGRNVVRTLPDLLKANKQNYRILAVTRDAKTPAALSVAGIPDVELIEKDWTEIDASWLKENGVARAYVTSHNTLSQFTDESRLFVAMLHAGVKYIVKISTTEEDTRPASSTFYGPAHWALEQMLSQPDFESLQWTSLRPNAFAGFILAPVVQWVKDFKRTGKQEPLKLVLGADDATALIDADDIGNVGAALLALEDPTPHNKARYILRGPKDISGKGLVDLVEQHAGVKVHDVLFRDTSIINDAVKYGYPAKLVPSMLAGLKPMWEGKATTFATPTSRAILELAPPKIDPSDVFKTMLEA